MSSKRVTDTTGPKTSRRTISSLCKAPATTVGSKKKPRAPACLPPAAIAICLLSSARSTNEETRDLLPGGDERTDVILVVIRLIELEGFRGGGEFSDELVHINLFAGVDAAGGRAVLSRVVVAERFHAVDYGGEIGVIERDDGPSRQARDACA